MQYSLFHNLITLNIIAYWTLVYEDETGLYTQLYKLFCGPPLNLTFESNEKLQVI